MARKLEADFGGDGEENLPCSFMTAQPMPIVPDEWLQEWLHADPRLTTDQLIKLETLGPTNSEKL